MALEQDERISEAFERERSRLRRFAHYQECLQLLERHLPHSPLVANLRAEIDRLPDVLTRQYTPM